MDTARILVPSAIGPWVVEGDADGITEVHMPNDRVRPTASVAPRALTEAATQLSEYFAKERTTFSVDLHLRGTPFQHDVWLALAAIPYGEVRSYADIAISIGRPHAYRAVGNANGRNPWPIFVPCHRVIAVNGLGGYGGGLDVKMFLLRLEDADTRGVDLAEPLGHVH